MNFLDNFFDLFELSSNCFLKSPWSFVVFCRKWSADEIFKKKFDTKTFPQMFDVKPFFSNINR